jgi:signal transduction histidine kinase
VTPEDALELFAAVPIGILSVTRDGRIRGGNFAAARLLDVPLKSLEGTSLVELAGDDERTALASLLAADRFDDRELPLRTKAGERRHLVASARSLPDSSLAIIFRDTSAEIARQAKRATEEKMASLGRLAAGIAHEFGNIMAKLYGYAQLAERDPSRHGELIAAIAEASQRAQIVTDALRAFEQAPSGELEPFDMSDIVAKVLNVLHPEIERAQVKVERKIVGRGPVLGQRSPLEEAVLAVVRNAIEACRGPSGKVTVALAEVEGLVQVTVTDNGPGIRVELRDRIFDPFFTTKGSLGGGPSASGGAGLGLGLAVAWNRLREHGGELDFASAEGQGASFRITLPRRPEALARPDVTPQPMRRPTARRRPRRTILVVDADESSRSLVEAVLKADHWVRAVTTGEDAIAAYDAPRAFDYVVLDLALGGEPGGRSVFKALRAKDPRARIVLLAGERGDDAALRECSPEAYAVLRKPGQLKDVRELLA